MTTKQLQELQRQQPAPEERVDISAVKLDIDAPAHQRAEQYLAQVKNPYAFRCAGIGVNVEFSDGGKPLRQAMQSYLSAQKKRS